MLAAIPRDAEVPSRLRVHRLPAPKATERGILYRRGEDPYLLAWARIQRAFAAAVGDGTACILIDLVVETRGPECVVCRIEAEGVEQAAHFARAALLALGPDACDRGVRGLAEDGVVVRRHAEPDVFGESVLEAVRFLA